MFLIGSYGKDSRVFCIHNAWHKVVLGFYRFYSTKYVHKFKECTSAKYMNLHFLNLKFRPISNAEVSSPRDLK
jgi:hypothetical protein